MQEQPFVRSFIHSTGTAFPLGLGTLPCSVAAVVSETQFLQEGTSIPVEKTDHEKANEYIHNSGRGKCCEERGSWRELVGAWEWGVARLQ